MEEGDVGDLNEFIGEPEAGGVGDDAEGSAEDVGHEADKVIDGGVFAAGDVDWAAALGGVLGEAAEGLGGIGGMDVIAAGFGVAEVEFVALAELGDDFGDDVGVGFAGPVIIEEPAEGDGEAVLAGLPAAEVFAEGLAPAVNIDGRNGGLFVEGFWGVGVNGAGGGVDEVLDAGGDAGLEEPHGGLDIDAEGAGGVAVTFRDVVDGGEVVDDGGFEVAEEGADGGVVGEVGLVDGDGLEVVQSRGDAVAVIEDGHGVLAGELASQLVADESESASDQVHRLVCMGGPPGAPGDPPVVPGGLDEGDGQEQARHAPARGDQAAGEEDRQPGVDGCPDEGDLVAGEDERSAIAVVELKEINQRHQGQPRRRNQRLGSPEQTEQVVAEEDEGEGAGGEEREAGGVAMEELAPGLAGLALGAEGIDGGDANGGGEGTEEEADLEQLKGKPVAGGFFESEEIGGELGIGVVDEEGAEADEAGSPGDRPDLGEEAFLEAVGAVGEGLREPRTEDPPAADSQDQAAHEEAGGESEEAVPGQESGQRQGEADGVGGEGELLGLADQVGAEEEGEPAFAVKVDQDAEGIAAPDEGEGEAMGEGAESPEEVGRGEEEDANGGPGHAEVDHADGVNVLADQFEVGGGSGGGRIGGEAAGARQQVGHPASQRGAEAEVGPDGQGADPGQDIPEAEFFVGELAEGDREHEQGGGAELEKLGEERPRQAGLEQTLHVGRTRGNGCGAAAIIGRAWGLGAGKSIFGWHWAGAIGFLAGRVNDQVTIGIPVYNRTTYFRQALESALRQTAVSPIVVVDNASDRADFPAILREYAHPSLSYQRNPRNLGMGGNWNECLRLCRTPYLLIVHDDDFLETDYVEQFLGRRQAGVVLAWCDVGIVDGGGRVVTEKFVPDMGAYGEVLDWCFHHPVRAGAIFHVPTALRLGGFRTDLKFTLDWDLWFRLLLAGPRQYLPVRGAWYRDYVDADRGTSQLQVSPKLTFYRRNQCKRNFHRLGAPARYRDYLRTGRIPGVSLPEVLALWPRLSARQRRYFAAVCVLTPSITVGGKLVRLLVRGLGPLGITLARPLLGRGL